MIFGSYRVNASLKENVLAGGQPESGSLENLFLRESGVLRELWIELVVNAPFQQLHCNRLTLKRKRKYIVNKILHFLFWFVSCVTCCAHLMGNASACYRPFQWSAVSQNIFRIKHWITTCTDEFLNNSHELTNRHYWNTEFSYVWWKIFSISVPWAHTQPWAPNPCQTGKWNEQNSLLKQMLGRT